MPVYKGHEKKELGIHLSIMLIGQEQTEES